MHILNKEKMMNFKERITVEGHKDAYRLSNKVLLIERIVWSVIFGVLLIAFLIAILASKDLENKGIFVTILIVLVVAVAFFNFLLDLINYHIRQNRINKLRIANKKEIEASIGFDEEKIEVRNPLFPKDAIRNINYRDLSQVYFDNELKILLFLVKGDTSHYFYLSLENKNKEELIKAIKLIDYRIDHQDLLEEYLGIKIETKEEAINTKSNEDITEVTLEIKDEVKPQKATVIPQEEKAIEKDPYKDMEISKEGIIKAIKKNDKETKISLPSKAYLPVRLKLNSKTYAMIYDDKAGVRIVLALNKKQVSTIKEKHPLLVKAKFPKGDLWYQIIFNNKTPGKDVYGVLMIAKEEIV